MTPQESSFGLDQVGAVHRRVEAEVGREAVLLAVDLTVLEQLGAQLVEARDPLRIPRLHHVDVHEVLCVADRGLGDVGIQARSGPWRAPGRRTSMNEGNFGGLPGYCSAYGRHSFLSSKPRQVKTSRSPVSSAAVVVGAGVLASSVSPPGPHPARKALPAHRGATREVGAEPQELASRRGPSSFAPSPGAACRSLRRPAPAHARGRRRPACTARARPAARTRRPCGRLRSSRARSRGPGSRRPCISVTWSAQVSSPISRLPSRPGHGRASPTRPTSACPRSSSFGREVAQPLDARRVAPPARGRSAAARAMNTSTSSTHARAVAALVRVGRHVADVQRRAARRRASSTRTRRPRSAW